MNSHNCEPQIGTLQWHVNQSLPLEPGDTSQCDVINFTISKHLRPITFYVPKSHKNNFTENTFKSIQQKGKNFRLYIGDNADLKNVKINVKGHNNTLIIGSNTTLKGDIVLHGHNLTVIICAHTTWNNVAIHCKEENNGVYIGKDCMFSSGIEIRTSDSHSIISLDSKTKTNKAQGVFIGDHVWVGKNSLINKGAIIPGDCVIGFGTLVNKPLSSINCAYGGQPAKIIKTNITWDRHRDEPDAVSNLYLWKNFPYV